MNQQDGFGWKRPLTASLATVIVAVSCCSSVLGEERNGMLLIPARNAVVGTSAAQREALAKRFDCHPTWLEDPLSYRTASGWYAYEGWRSAFTGPRASPFMPSGRMRPVCWMIGQWSGPASEPGE